MMENRYYRINRSDICYLKYLLESYEGVATMSTLDAAEGRVVVRIAPGCSETVSAVMDALSADVYFEPLEAPGENGERRSRSRSS